MFYSITNARRNHAYTIQSSEHFDEYCLAKLNLLNGQAGKMKKEQQASQASVSSIAVASMMEKKRMKVTKIRFSF
jgi:hypothetical protein